ncbi:hypothetical protein BLL37_26260 [Pseudomonas azotoformans]|uniref:Uncharacterized protein n=1 Tax=Pseudomonas azotoformans TaxID=47878 RepID=A0A1V2J8B3_PSEAZ|nr:hypothetical protein BFL39_13190 [Pseudomonas azotoformans]ONH41658.1 hypothetical protein BLL37_26260 [Pseudomonas azotoformans]
MRQAGSSETQPGLQWVACETRASQLNTQQQMIFMAIQAQLVVVFIQPRVRLMAIQTIKQG